MKSALNSKYLLGQHLNGKRILGIADKNRVLFQEIYKLATGTDITLTDTKNDEGKITGFECASSQVITVQGKNLVDINNLSFKKTGSNTTYEVSNNKLNISGLWYVAFTFNVIQNTTYYVKAAREYITDVTGAGNIAAYDENVSARIMDGGRGSFNFNSGSNSKITLVFYSGNGTTDGNVNFSNIMLSTQDIPYEQFIPNSPSSDYPSPIQSTGDGGILTVLTDVGNRNYYRELRGIVGERPANSAEYIDCDGYLQTLHIKNATAYVNIDSTMSSDYINHFTANTDITVSVLVKNITNTLLKLYYGDVSGLNMYKSFTEDLDLGNGWKWYKVNFTPLTNNVSPRLNFNTNGECYIAKIKIEKGLIRTPYVSAIENIDTTSLQYPITLPDGFVGGSLPNGLKDTHDMQRIGKVVLNGVIGVYEGLSKRTNTVRFYVRNIINGLMPQTTENINLRCSHFIPKLIYNLDEEGIYMNYASARYQSIYISINKSRLSEVSIAAITTWLSQNPVTVYYELDESIPVTITLPLINTYDQYTKIECTNAVKPVMTVKYLEK